MLQQVFCDLMNNAIQAMSHGGKIDIWVKSVASDHQFDDGKYMIKVSDTGVGIDQKHLNKIFDPFFTTKDEGKGTGLGLSTVYLILEKHKGTISVESQLGKGTTFTITIPLDAFKEKVKIHLPAP